MFRNLAAIQKLGFDDQYRKVLGLLKYFGLYLLCKLLGLYSYDVKKIVKYHFFKVALF